MSNYRGVVVSVETTSLGDELAAAAASGAGTLTLTDLADFVEGAGALQIGDELHAYVAADDETGEVVLATTLDESYTVGEPVYSYPRGQVTTADVMLEDGGDPVRARVPHSLIALLPDGIRQPGEQEAVELLRQSRFDWQVWDLPDKTPEQSGEYTLPGTVPPDSVPPPEPPATSPDPTLRQFGVMALEASWEPSTAEQAVYDVWVSPTSGFTPDGTSYFGQTLGTSVVIGRDPATGERLELVPYYAVVQVSNPGGAAGYSTESDGVTPRQASNLEISAEFAYLGDVEMVQLKSGVGTFDLVLGGRIATAGLDDNGDQIYPYSVQDAAGWRQYGPGGAADIRTNLPNDPNLSARLVGVAELDRLNADAASLRGRSAFEKGSEVFFETGVQPPAVEPTPVMTCPQNSCNGIGAGFENTYHGMGDFDSTYWVTAVALFGGAVRKIRKDTGERAITDFCTLPNDYNARGGVTVLGSSVYTLGQYSSFHGPNAREYEWWVRKHSITTGALQAEWLWTTSWTGGDPALGHDGTNLTIGRVEIAGGNTRKIVLRGYDPTTGAGANLPGTGSSTLVTDVDVLQTGIGLASVQRTSADFGSTRYVITTKDRTVGSGNFTYVTDSAGARVANHDWPLGYNGPTIGMYWDGARFVQIGRNRIMYKYTGIVWTTESPIWWLSPTYRDADAGGTGLHETQQGPRAQFTMKKRWQLTMSLASIPDTGDADDPNTASFYLGRGSADPGRTGMYLQAAPSPPAVQGAGVSATITSVSGGFTSGTNPPASSNFPGATPAKAYAGSGELLFSGDGTSVWGPVGSIAMWPLGSAPTGWLKCDGSTVSRTTYARLFAIIGTTFGAGDGSTTFGLPDLRGRFPIGAGTFAALATNDGLAEASRTPRHLHAEGTLATGLTNDRAAGAAARATSAITGNTSLSAANAIPYAALHFIIKT